jgi:hypothetical protein
MCACLQTPNTTNSLCGYKIVTGQPSDRLGEDFKELFIDFTERQGTCTHLVSTYIIFLSLLSYCFCSYPFMYMEMWTMDLGWGWEVCLQLVVNKFLGVGNCRLTVVEESAKATNRKLTQGMSEHNKAMSAAKTDAAKADVVCGCWSLTESYRCFRLPSCWTPERGPFFSLLLYLSCQCWTILYSLFPNKDPATGSWYLMSAVWVCRKQRNKVQA